MGGGGWWTLPRLLLVLLSFAGMAQKKGRLERRKGWERESERTSLGVEWLGGGGGLVGGGDGGGRQGDVVGVSDMKNAQKIQEGRESSPGKINEKNI